MGRLTPRIVVGAHYDIGDASDIDASRGDLKALRAGAAELKKDGKSADEAGKMLADEFSAKYPGWAQPARAWRPGSPRSTGSSRSLAYPARRKRSTSWAKRSGVSSHG